MTEKTLKAEDVLDNSDTENSFNASENPEFEDYLLNCLVILTKLEHKPFSAEALSAGLPLVNNKLTPEIFHRAAERAGFNSKIVKRSLKDISSLTLPVILLLTDERACVLESIDPIKEQARIILPESSKNIEKTISFKQLEEIYLSFSIFVRSEFSFDNRTPDNIITHNKHWFWGTIWQSKGIYRDVLIVSFFINLFVIATPLYIRTVMDRVVPNNSVETLWMLSAGVFLVFVFEFIFKTLRGYFIDVAGKKSDIIISSIIFERIMSMRMDVRPESVGAFSDNIRAYEGIRNFMTSATIAVFIDVPFFALFIIIIYLFAGSMAYIPLVFVLVLMLYSLVIMGPIRKMVEKNFRGSLQKNATLVESMTAVETIKTMGAEGNAQRKWEEPISFMAQQGLKVRLMSQSINNFSAFVQHLSTIAVFVYGMHLIHMQEMSMGTLFFCFILTRRAISPMGKLAALIGSYQNTKSAFDSLNEIMKLPVEREKEQQFLNRENFQGDIQFKEVNFSYPKQGIKALSNINFSIKAGEKVAFIGRIGSGKTTLEKMIMGLYLPSEGQVRVDGIDIKQIDPADLRRNIGYVAQDINLFHGTVKDNIRIRAPYVSDIEILRVADLAGVTNFTNRHPMGFDMPVKERGEGLSGGQRQSIAIARALLLSPPILLMDEPSNAMDNNSEAELKNRLENEIKDRTLILITHRASLLTLVDRLIVLDNGGIIADGPKQQVLDALKQGKLKIKKD